MTGIEHCVIIGSFYPVMINPVIIFILSTMHVYVTVTVYSFVIKV